MRPLGAFAPNMVILMITHSESQTQLSSQGHITENIFSQETQSDQIVSDFGLSLREPKVSVPF